MPQSRFAVITFMDGDGGSIDNSLPFPGWGSFRPDNSLPSNPAHPGNALPPPGSIATLPVFPFDPTRPDNSLPEAPIQIRPGMKFVVKWLACQGLILVPDNSLPSSGGSVDNTLPETAEPK